MIATPADSGIEKTVPEKAGAEKNAAKPASDAPGKQRSFWQLLGALFVALWRALAGFVVSVWQALPWRYRVNVVSRALAGCVGGYYLAAASAGLWARFFLWLGVARNDATLSGQMLGFITLAVAVMWAFGCASQRRAWLGVALPAAVLWTVSWWFRTGGVL